MNIETLKQDPFIQELVEKIMSNDQFLSKCESNFKLIFDDGKIDGDDIPIIINLILSIYNNYNKIRIKPAKMKQVFMLLISKLLNKFKGDIEIDETLILMMLEPQIDLLFTSINISKKFSCCSSKPNPEAEEAKLTKIRLHKLEKEKLTLIPDN
jgi:hypothetical protein